MNHGNRTLAALLGLLLLAGSPALAGDDGKAPPPAEPKDGAPKDGAKKDPRPVSSDEAAKQAIERFDRDFKSSDMGKKMNALHSLSGTKNDLVAKKLGTLLSHPEAEIRMAAAMTLDSQYQNHAIGGELLRKFIASGKEDDDEVLINACLTLGRIDYREAIPEMGELAQKNGNIFVKIEALKSFEKMKDVKALLPILDLWLVNPQGYSWEGGEVKYDSGAAGDADQKEAERQYKAKYGNQRRRGAPPTMLKTYIQAIVEAVAAITGEKLSSPTELMKWMVDHEKELPYKLPGKVKQAYEESEAKRAKAEKEKAGKGGGGK